MRAKMGIRRDADVVPESARLHHEEPMSGPKRKRLTLKTQSVM